MKKIFILIGLCLLICAQGYCATNQPQNIGYSKTDNPFQLFSTTLTALNALTPDTTAQLIHCSNCVQTPVCVSTGTGAGAWVAVSVSTGASVGFGVCK